LLRLPRVALPGHTIIGLAGSYAPPQNVRHMGSLRLQMKTDNLLDADYEQVVGFS
jgi:outer membrane cobalamin receptor